MFVGENKDGYFNTHKNVIAYAYIPANVLLNSVFPIMHLNLNVIVCVDQLVGVF
jgi:hypothetical protein